MTYRGPREPKLRRAWQHERRAEIRRYHPDRGGDPATLRARLTALDHSYDARERQPASGMVRRVTRGVRRGLRGVRSRIPRSWPGSRRYFDV